MRKMRLGLLLSGRGSNFKAIVQAIQQGQLPHAEIALVISNHAEAGGLAFAREQNLATACFPPDTHPTRMALDQAMAEILKEYQVDLVILAGFDRILGPHVLSAYPHRILNIHPSLLPAYGGKGMVGLKVHAAVLKNGEKESGCTVHVVTETVDGGPILGQAKVAVAPSDTPECLAQKVLEQEHRLYPEMIGNYIQQLFKTEGTALHDATHV